MSKPKVVVIDYGIGNLLSVQRGLEHSGADVILTGDPDVIRSGSHVVLPGVGAFVNGMAALEKLGLVPVLKDVAEQGTPLLGICLGMQLFLEQSEEFGVTEGLGLIPGQVRAIPNYSTTDASIKVPHIGWNGLLPSENSNWEDTWLADNTSGDEMYFVHSFMAIPRDNACLISDCIYGGHRIPAVIGKDNVMGCQFHPEKSGEFGLKILKKFCTS